MSDRVFIVTGGARGIGYACARRLLEDGYRVVLSDMDLASGRKALEELGSAADKAVFVECDVSEKLEVHNLVADALSAFGRIDGLINNAGIALKGGALDLSEADFDRVLAVNSVAIPDYLAYTISKGGLLQMTRAMALELAPYGIRVNAIGPGSVKTDMLAGVAGDALEKIHSRTPLGRIALPYEVASVASFLAGEDSSYRAFRLMRFKPLRV